MYNNNPYQGLILKKNPDYKDADYKQGPSDSYQATTLSITKCNKSKWYFSDSLEYWNGSTY